MSILHKIELGEANNGLQDAWSLQTACAHVGFDWSDFKPVMSKVTEELAEVNEAIENPNKTSIDIEEEIGDLLFACVNLARHLNLDPVQSLYKANCKFKARFEEIEKLLIEQNASLVDTNAEQFEQLWQQAKHNVKNHY